MTRHVLVVATLLLGAACSSDPGPEGPIGPTGPAGPPYDREDVYCVLGATVNLATSWSVTITCGHVADIPIQGSCYALDQPAAAYLASSRAADWSNPSVAAGWTCQWGWQPGTEPADPTFSFQGISEICSALVLHSRDGGASPVRGGFWSIGRSGTRTLDFGDL